MLDLPKSNLQKQNKIFNPSFSSATCLGQSLKIRKLWSYANHTNKTIDFTFMYGSREMVDF